MDNVNVVVVGCGHWGKNIIRCLKQMNCLRGVFDLSAETMDKNAEGVPQFVSWKSVLRDQRVDAVVIALPVEHHYKYAMEALMAGKHIWVEKPMTSTYEEAVMLKNEVEKRNAVCLVGHLLEYHPAVQKLREFVDKGVIGEVREVYSHRLNAGKVRDFENVWWSFAPHDILLLLNTLKMEVTNIRSYMSDYLNRGVSDSTMTIFEFDKKVTGHIYVSWMHPYKFQSFVVIGTEGALEFTDTSIDKLKLYHNKFEKSEDGNRAVLTKGEFESVAIGDGEPLMSECKDFIHCIRTGEKPLSSEQEGWKVVEILEMSNRFARNR